MCERKKKTQIIKSNELSRGRQRKKDEPDYEVIFIKNNFNLHIRIISSFSRVLCYVFFFALGFFHTSLCIYGWFLIFYFLYLEYDLKPAGVNIGPLTTGIDKKVVFLAI